VAAAAALLGCFALDSLAFRTPWYPAFLQPDSSTGLFEWILWRERVYAAKAPDNVIITVGDSRLAYAPKLSNAVEPETGYLVRSAGVAGSDARTWYYMLRALDPTASRYRAVVIGLNTYADEDAVFEPDDDIRALHYAINQLRLTDILPFARSFYSPSVQAEAFRGALLKGIVFQTDLLQFLDNPRARIRQVRFNRTGFENWTYDFLGMDKNMTGLEVDWNTFQVHLPPQTDPNDLGTVTAIVAATPAPQTGRLAAFRRLWLGRIADYYRNSRTKIVFIRLARGPLVRPERIRPNDYVPSSIHELAARPNVLLADPEAFDSLEHPELFADGLHLNKTGVALFSPMLARTVARMLGPASPR
jgi:hypothetical protein